MPPTPTATAQRGATDPTDAVRETAAGVRTAIHRRDAALVVAYRDGTAIAALARAADLDAGTVRRIIARSL